MARFTRQHTVMCALPTACDTSALRRCTDKARLQVPVYECNVNGNHVMRRRADDWINATHILKVADYDKPARTRILEREVQKGVHEKVQGGYGKYQGTWIPLEEGRHLAERNGVLDKMRAIFDYVPGDRSPPPAPKHATAASNRMKPPKQTAAAAAAAARNGKNVYSLESMQCRRSLSLVIVQALMRET